MTKQIFISKAQSILVGLISHLVSFNLSESTSSVFFQHVRNSGSEEHVHNIVQSSPGLEILGASCGRCARLYWQQNDCRVFWC